MFGKIAGAFNALKAGESLTHSGTWKNIQVLGTALTTVIAFIVMFLPPQYALTPDQVTGVVAGLVSFAGVFNSYLTVATSDKVGTGKVPTESAPADDAPKSEPKPTASATEQAQSILGR